MHQSIVNNQEPIYLSIDIDFFRFYIWSQKNKDYYPVSDEEFEKFLVGIFEMACEKEIEIHAMMNHHQMLSLVNESQARRLVNIDMHSDLAGKDVDVLNIGTWVSYVKWRREGEFVWMRNDRELYVGECGYHFKKQQTKDTDWNKVKTYVMKSIPKIELIEQLNVVGIGVCMSPSFCDPSHGKIFQKLVKRYNIPYKKGRKDESEIPNKHIFAGHQYKVI